MLSAVSQPIVHKHYVPQQSLAETNQRASNSESKDKGVVKSAATKPTQQATEELSQQDQQKVAQLKQRDQEVKTHEQAHLSAAGAYAIGGASFTYQTGPNGVRYAVGGEVNISTSAIKDDPAATLKKADTIRRAALAPENPSSQDQRVAAKATSMAGKARIDLVELSQQQEQEKQIKLDEKEQDSGDGSQVKNKDKTASRNTVEPKLTLGSLLDISV